MCGLFGALGPKIEEGKIRGLGLINRQRGTDAVGFFDDRGKMCKMAKDAMRGMATESMAGFITKACNESWFVAGHTRASSMGTGQGDDCAHPFRYGKTIGSHNGVVMAPKEYKVDSQYLFHLISHFDQDYQKALVDISGYFALTWYDKKRKHFYFLCHDNEITIGKYGDTYYYSSDPDHLEAACGLTDTMIKMECGDVIRFSHLKDGYVTTEVLDKFKSNAQSWKLTRSQRAQGWYDTNWAGSYSATNYSSSSSKGSEASEPQDLFTKVSDYTAWAESWEEYLKDPNSVTV